MTVRLPHNRRSDARDNRSLIIDAARAAFVTDGLGVPVREIARRAEVGPATVYRHFPTKAMLAAEVFTEQTLAWRSAIDEGLAESDPWRGFRLTIEKLCERQARDHDLATALKTAFPRAVDFAAMRSSSLTSAAELIRRAKDTGRLRPDVVVDDLMCMMMAITGFHAMPLASRVAASHRLAALVIQGLEASPAASRLPPVS